MASKLKSTTAVFSIVLIVGASAYVVNWYRKYRDATPESTPDVPPRFSQFRKPAPPLKADPNGFAPMFAVEQRKPIREFETINRRQADSWLKEEELIIGVVVEGKARAYVINTMNGPDREILNDTLAGRPIAATW